MCVRRKDGCSESWDSRLGRRSRCKDGGIHDAHPKLQTRVTSLGCERCMNRKNPTSPLRYFVTPCRDKV